MKEEILKIIDKAFRFRNNEEYDWEQLKDVYAHMIVQYIG